MIGVEGLSRPFWTNGLLVPFSKPIPRGLGRRDVHILILCGPASRTTTSVLPLPNVLGNALKADEAGVSNVPGKILATRRVDFHLRRPGFWIRAERIIAISDAVRRVLIEDGKPVSESLISPS